MKFGNGPENKNGFVAMTHYCVLAVHLAFNVLRSPNHLHTLDAEARARKRAPFGLLHKPLSSGAKYTVLNSATLLNLAKSAETQCRLEFSMPKSKLQPRRKLFRFPTTPFLEGRRGKQDVVDIALGENR